MQAPYLVPLSKTRVLLEYILSYVFGVSSWALALAVSILYQHLSLLKAVKTPTLPEILRQCSGKLSQLSISQETLDDSRDHDDGLDSKGHERSDQIHSCIPWLSLFNTESNYFIFVCSMQGFGTLLCSLVLITVTQTLGDNYDAQWRIALGVGAVPMVCAFYFRWKMHETSWKNEVTLGNEVTTIKNIHVN